MSKVLYLIVHQHSDGATNYTTAREPGEKFDIEKFIKEENIVFEENKGEYISFEIIDLPEGFILTQIGDQNQNQKHFDELVNLIDSNNEDHINALDEIIHELYDNAATNINNGGVQDQVKHIIFELGAEQARAKIIEITQGSAATPST